jgi:putative ABC transport system ATP-binding protein
MIDIQNVTKTYYRGTTEVRALRGLTCQIPAAQLTFMVGPSGSGKSSLLYLLGGLDQPTSGEISIAGRSVTRMAARDRDRFRRDEVGFVFQNFNLLSNLSAVENVLVPYLPQGISKCLRESAEELLQRVGLGERLDHRPNQLSGGEQQRVAIARALLKKPLLVLADEPTGELDSESGAEIYRHLRTLRDEQGTTVVIVTHDRSHIRPTDHVVTLRDGRLAADGN